MRDGGRGRKNHSQPEGLLREMLRAGAADRLLQRLLRAGAAGQLYAWLEADGSRRRGGAFPGGVCERGRGQGRL